MSAIVNDAITLAQMALATGLTLEHRPQGGPTLRNIIDAALNRADSDEALATLIDLKRKLHFRGERIKPWEPQNPGVSATTTGETGPSQTQDASPEAVVRLVTPPKPEDQDRAEMLALLDEVRGMVDRGEVRHLVMLADAVEGGWFNRASSSAEFARWVGQLHITIARAIDRYNATSRAAPEPPEPAA